MEAQCPELKQQAQQQLFKNCFSRTAFQTFPLSVVIVPAQVLVIVAASHLDAVTFQICSQSFKIMPTALFAVWLLGQYLTPMQWASLPVLAVGVVLVTMNGSSGKLHFPLKSCG